MHSKEDEDYVWSFAVQAKTNAPVHEDPLIEMLRVFLEDFLNMGFLTCDGKQARIDGFAFANNPKEIYAIFRDHVKPGADDGGNRVTPAL